LRGNPTTILRGAATAYKVNMLEHELPTVGHLFVEELSKASLSGLKGVILRMKTLLTARN